MTPDLKKTLGFVVVALVLTGAAFVRLPDRSGSNIDFKDQGEEFFPAFKNPLDCTDLEVVDFDPSTASSTVFKVMNRAGKWVIPSHHNYPADAKDRLAKTASGVIDLRKDTVRSDSVAQHEAFGVLDPVDPKAGLKGLGKRVTLRDKAGNPLADFIIGKEIGDKGSLRYVRVPGKNRVYGVNVKVDLSTKFADWIETNLLKLDAAHIRSIKFDNYKVDPERGRLIRGNPVTIDRKDASSPWNIEGGIPEGQEQNIETLTAMTSALADLKIVGVRPKPEGLSKDLKLSSTNDVNLEKLTTQLARSLMSRGFYPTKDGIFSNQGEVIISTDEGAVYTLRFGEVNFETGEELSAGGKDDATSASKEKAQEKEKDGSKKAGGTTESRYLMVTVGFDPKLVPEPPKPKEEPVIPDDPFQKAPDDPKRIAEEKVAKEKLDREAAARDKQLADAEKKVKELSDRFADWYYLTPGDSFRAIALERPAMLRPKAAKQAGGAAPGMPPGFPGGFPGGLPDHP